MNTTENTSGGRTSRRQWFRDHSELGISLVLALFGVLVLLDAMAIDTDFTQRGPVGPKTLPIVIGVLLLLVAVLLAVDVLRGGRGEAETGEDIDLAAPSDWRTVLLLAAVFLANAVLINVIGFPLSGMLLFWGAAYVLGSRNLTRDPLVAAVLSLTTYFTFHYLLGVHLPGGPLMGVL